MSCNTKTMSCRLIPSIKQHIIILTIITHDFIFNKYYIQYFKIIFGAVTDQDAISYLIYFTNIKTHEIININNNSLNCVDFTIKSETSFIQCSLGPEQFRIGETLR